MVYRTYMYLLSYICIVYIFFRTPGMVAVATPSRRTRNNKKPKLSRRARLYHCYTLREHITITTVRFRIARLRCVRRQRDNVRHNDSTRPCFEFSRHVLRRSNIITHIPPSIHMATAPCVNGYYKRVPGVRTYISVNVKISGVCEND